MNHARGMKKSKKWKYPKLEEVVGLLGLVTSIFLLH